MPSNKFQLRLTAVLLALALLPVSSCGKSSRQPRQDPDKKYNVILVVSDALRRDVLGCYGGPARTPNLDRLARRGVLFENAYSTSPWTPPSAVAIFSGNYATSYYYSEFEKTIKVHVPDQERFLAEVMGQLGYQNAVKIGNIQADIHNCTQGFNDLPEELFINEDDKTAIERITRGRIREADAGYINSFIVLHHLLHLPADQNFFIVQWILDPHEPYRPVQAFARRIKADRTNLTRPIEYYTSHATLDCELTESDRRYLMARYLAEVESVDERIGYLIKMLEHKNMMHRTFFVFTSDHGEHFGEHGLYGHGIHYYQNLVRVPLIIAGPGLLPGQRVSARVSVVGVMPTIKELLGVEYEDNMQGESLVKYLSGQGGSARPVYCDDIREHEMVDALIDRNYKLIPLKSGRFELYDLARDPSELNNIAAGHEQMIQSMLSVIKTNRRQNFERQSFNQALLDSTGQQLSEQEKAEMLEKLKALGYIN